MKFVLVEPIVEDGWTKGYSLDPTPYLDELPVVQDKLPEGARSFALDPNHYDFSGPLCIKDLKVTEVSLRDQNDTVSLEIAFAPNRFKHDAGLVLSYVDVVEFAVQVTADPRTKNVWPETRRLGDAQLDELLPHEKGFSHEIAMTGGSLWIVAADLRSKWTASER